MKRNQALTLLSKGIPTPDLVTIAQRPERTERWNLLGHYLVRLVREYDGVENTENLGPELRALRFNNISGHINRKRHIQKILGDQR